MTHLNLDLMPQILKDSVKRLGIAIPNVDKVTTYF
jgi:hypothetical protein